MSLSVIIITLNRMPILRRCLDALLPQLLPEDELVIVTASDPPIERELEKTDGRIRVICSEKRNMPHQRNVGLKVARHDVVAFLDDDAMAQPGWRAAIMNPYADPQTDSAVGKVITPGFEHSRNIQPYDGIHKQFIDISLFAATVNCRVMSGQGCNMSFRKRVFDQVGYFDENIIVKAYGEESDMFFRMQKHDMHVIYAPDAAVIHECAEPEGYKRSNYDWRSVYYTRRNYTYLLTKREFPSLRWLWIMLLDSVRPPGRYLKRLGLIFGHTLLLLGANCCGLIVGFYVGFRTRVNRKTGKRQ